ncbi:LCP family protein, partial [Candidatus Daviesbacteria bacterium]|nr:LCP family protein [Candidatus Daviesbacteria bacterium]
LKKIELASVKKKKSKKFWLSLFVLIILVVGGLFVVDLFSGSSSSVFTYVLSKGNTIKSTDDRVNILLLGNAGGKHDGPELTDSIIVASYNLKTSRVTLISVPRDLWLDSIKAKVNAAYEIGNKTSQGLKFSEDKIDDILGVPIHYGIRVDFDGFAKAIDLVGGVDLEVPKTFDDYNYPITDKEDDSCGLVQKEVDLDASIAAILHLSTGKQTVFMTSDNHIASTSADFACRFEHLHFDQGLTHMDGELALKFVRSRMGTNGEGSDFARSRRQQLVLQAFRKKALSLETLTSPSKVASVVTTLGQSIETDIPADRFIDFFKLIKNMEGVDSLVLGDLGKGQSLLINPPAEDFGGAYVLIPENNDLNKVHDFIKTTLDKTQLPK